MKRALRTALLRAQKLDADLIEATCDAAMHEVQQVEEECETAIDCLFLTDHPHGRLGQHDARFECQLASPDDTAIAHELHDVLTQVVCTLPSWREREIIKLLYGLGDNYVYSYAEVAHIFRVTLERIKQIEGKAVRQLQLPSRCNVLAEFA